MTTYYKQTNVSTSRSQESIERFLKHFGILETRFTNTAEQIVFEFNYPLQKGDKNLKVGVRLIVHLPESKNQDQTRKQYYRILLHHLKAKFIAVETGLAEFGHEFLGDLLYSLPNGKQVTVGEIVGPMVEKNIAGDRSGLLMLPEYTSSRD
jgi:hypothetical protein